MLVLRVMLESLGVLLQQGHHLCFTFDSER